MNTRRRYKAKRRRAARRAAAIRRRTWAALAARYPGLTVTAFRWEA
jgi:hypothetical protein